MSLSAWSPFGPIFGKELRTTARRKRTYLLRFLYLGLLLLVLWGVYLETNPDRWYQYGGGVARRAQQTAALGNAFFVGFSMFCVIAMGVISPVLTATAVSAERMSKTLNVLLMTPITSWQIVSGKLLSRLLAAFTLLGLSLPVLAVVRLLGGVDLDRMLAVLALCMVTSLFAAAVGLFYSTFMNRAYAVILLSYVTLLFFYLFVPFILALTLPHSGRPKSGFFEFVAATNPIFMTFAVSSGERMLRGVSSVPTLVVHLVATTLLVMACGAVLRKLARREGGGADAVAAGEPVPPFGADPFENLAPAGSIPPPPPPGVIVPDYVSAARPHHLQPRPARDVSDNPVLWRELRRPLTTKRWQAVTFTVGSIALLLLTYLGIAADRHNGLAQADAQIGFAIVFCGLLTLLICVISATGIAGEKESDTWTLLLATPMTARAIVLGKLAGQLRRLLWPGALILGHFALFTVTGVLPVPAFVLILWILVTFNLIWVATGMYLSLRVRRVTFAVTLNLLMPIAVFPLAMVLLLILGNLCGEGDRWVEAVAWYAPYPYFIGAVEGYGWRKTFPLPYNHAATFEQFVTAVFFMGLLYLAVSALLVKYTISRFDRIVGRSPQRAPAEASTSPAAKPFLPGFHK